MSLSGRLEDLQLRDLLQILSLSRNDGLLQLHCGCDKAELLFSEGLVFSTWRQVADSDDALAAGFPMVIDEALLVRARRLQQKIVPFRTLDRLLIEECGLEQKNLYSELRFAVVASVKDLLHWHEGDFSFQPGPATEILQDVACGEHLCLYNGLGVAELLHEEPATLPATKGLPTVLSDPGDTADGSSCLAQKAEHAAVLLVDDDPQIAVQLVRALAQQGFSARSFSGGGELLKAAQSAWGAGQQPLLIIDLIMPRLHGGGILGGLELVEQIRSMQAKQEFLVYSDYPCLEVEKRLLQLGVKQLLDKPCPQSFSAGEHSAAAAVFCDTLAEKARVLLPNPATILARKSPAGPGSEVFPCESEPEKAEAVHSSGMGVLKGMLQELKTVERADQVMLLALRFASEILNRAVLFSVDKDRIVGLGQFGYGEVELSADEKVRRISVPLAEPSSFKEVLEQTVAHSGPLGDGPWDRYLCQELGLSCSDEVFIGPLLRDGQVVALLCGDNQNSHRGIENSPALVIFLQQAGIALENLQMADKLRNLTTLLGKSIDC